MAQKYAPYSYSLTDTPYFGYEIHIAKTSAGWLPLFQSHKDGIQSIKEYEKAYSTGKFEIWDEYRNFYTWNEFDDRVLKFNGGVLGIEKPEKVTKSEKFQDEYMPEYIPISHIPDSKQSYKYRFNEDFQTVFKDADGYEFEENEFE